MIGNKKYKKVINDMMINTIASMIPILILQLYILPKTSLIVGDSIYGLLVTYLSIFNIIPVTFGNVLNNIRLLNDNKESGNGDYNILLFIFEIISTIILLFLTLFYVKDFNILSIMLTILLGILWLYREYHIVIFRIELDYLNALRDSIILSIGYLIGFVFVRITGKWQLIYIVGYIFSIIFITFKSKLYKESFKKTKYFKKLVKDSAQLTLSNIIARSITYADKLIIYPILGSYVVSVYYSASIFSKITNLALSPIASVILSYVTKMKSNENKIFTSTLKVSSLVLTIGSFFCFLIAKPVLYLIYPQYATEAIKYVPIILMGMLFSTLSHILNPFILKFYKMKWQIIINGITLLFYLITSLILLNKYNLIGFCYGILLANLLKLVLLLGLYYIKKGGKIKNERE